MQPRACMQEGTWETFSMKMRQVRIRRSTAPLQKSFRWASFAIHPASMMGDRRWLEEEAHRQEHCRDLGMHAENDTVLANLTGVAACLF